MTFRVELIKNMLTDCVLCILSPKLTSPLQFIKTTDAKWKSQQGHGEAKCGESDLVKKQNSVLEHSNSSTII